MEPIAGGRNPFLSLASTIVVSALVVVFASVALASWPTADDYCNRVLVAARGIDGAMQWLFFEWSGRLATSSVLYSTFALVDLPSLRWISLALCALFAIVAYQIATLVALDDRLLRLPLWAFVLAALSLGLYRLLGQTVFWVTGGIVYLLPLALTLLWLVPVRRLFRGEMPQTENAYGFALGVLVGNSIELVLPIIGAYVVLMAPGRWMNLSSYARRALGWRIAGVVVGALALIAAPGNYARATVTPDSFRGDPAYLAGEYGRMLAEIGSRAWPMVAIIFGLLVVSIVVSILQRPSAASNDRPSPWRESAAFALGAFFSIAPVLAAPVQFAPRNALYLFVFALVAVLIPIVASIRRLRRRGFALTGVVVLAAVGAVYAAAPLVEDAQASAEFRDRQIARDRALKQLPQPQKLDAVVEGFGLTVPRTLHFIELDADRTQWNNVCTAKYYGLRSIALAPKPK